MTSILNKRISASIQADVTEKDGKIELFFEGIPNLRMNDELSYQFKGETVHLNIQSMQQVTNKNRPGPAMKVITVPVVFQEVELVTKAIVGKSGDSYTLQFPNGFSFKDENGETITLAAPEQEIQTKKENEQ